MHTTISAGREREWVLFEFTHALEWFVTQAKPNHGDDTHNAFIGWQRAQPEQVNWANLFHDKRVEIRTNAYHFECMQTIFICTEMPVDAPNIV